VQYAPKITGSETEAPFSVYLEAAKEQVARARAAGMLEFLPYRDAEYARLVAIGNRESDRKDRHYAANKERIDAANRFVNARFDKRYAEYAAELNAPARPDPARKTLKLRFGEGVA